MLRVLLACIAAALLLSPGAARAEGPVTGEILDIDDSAFPEVRTMITVIDSTGRPVLGLIPESFSVEETGAPGTVSQVDVTLDLETGLAVMITIDTSGSMWGEPMTQAKATAAEFVRNLAPNDHAGLINFSTGATVRQPLTNNRDHVLAAIDNLQALGNTALYSAVGASITEATKATLSRRAIVFVSDGVDFGGVSDLSREESLARAAQARIPFYVVGLGDEIDRPYLEELARASGGAYFDAPTPAELPGIYAELSELLRTRYLLVMNSTADSEVRQRSLTINVNTPEGPVQLTAQYNTRRIIVPPTAVIPVLELPATTPSEGIDLLPYLLALVALVALLTSGRYGYVVISKRRQESRLAAITARAVSTLEAAPPVVVQQGPGLPRLYLSIDGPGGNRRVEAGGRPRTIGSDESCDIRLEEGGADVAPQHARIWPREGKLMFHEIREGSSAGWLSLSAGDEVKVGPYTLRVEVS